MNLRNRLFNMPVVGYPWLSVLLFSFISFASFAQPTTGASNLVISNVEGDRMRLTWTRGNGGNVLIVASTSSTFNGTGVPANATDYTANQIFGTGDPVGTGNFAVYRSTGSNITVSGLIHSTTYYFRLYEFNGINFSTLYNTTNVLAGQGTTLSPPTVGVSNFSATPTGNTAPITWTRGNGTRVTLILQPGSAAPDPLQYTTYTASPVFGAGSAIGSARVMYIGTGVSVTLGNLQPNTQYFYRFVESNGTSGPVYDLPNALTGSFTTLKEPTVGSTGLVPSGAQGNEVSVSFTPGNGTQRLIVARQDNPVVFTPVDGTDYNVNSTYGLGDNLGNNTFAVGEGNGTGITVSGLTPATTYHFAVFEFNGVATNTFYLTTAGKVLAGPATTLSPPPTSTSNLTFSNITGYNATVTFTPGNGTSRLVLAKPVSAVTDIPVTLVNYTASNNFAAAGSLGASKIVYEGNGGTFNLQSLQPNTTYHFAVFEFNGTTGPVYKQADPGIGSFTTLGKPTVSPTNLVFSNAQGDRVTATITSGNGFGRIVIAKQGAPVDVFPTDFTTYTANGNFGTAGAHIGNGNYVIQNSGQIGGTSSVIMGSLAIGTTYHLAVIEYNGTGTERIYMSPAQALIGSGSTLVAPTVQPTNLAFSNITSNTLTVSWQNGNGSQRMLLLRKDQAVQNFPANLITYNSSNNFGINYVIGTSKVMYDGNLSTVNIVSIPPGTYHVAVLEYNGTTQPVYQTVNPLVGTVNVGDKPPIAATNLAFSNILGNQMTLGFTRGNGLSRMLIAKLGSAVDAWPVDFIGYTANGNFGAGSDLGGGNFVVGASTANSFSVSALAPGSTYHFAIVEYNGSGASAYYQDPLIVLKGSNMTLSAPTVPTSSFFANNVTGNKMQLTWTRGSGNGRLIITKAGSPVDYVPTNLTDPPASGSVTSANLGGGNFGVYSGVDENTNLTNMEPGTTYHFASFEYNGASSGKVYLTNPVGRTSFTTAPRPSVAPKNLTINNVNGDRFSMQFTVGNGTKRLVVIRKGGLVNELPVDLTTYNIGAFGAGSLLANGNYVTGFTTGNNSSVTGLEPNTSYGVAVFEVDGSVGNERYMTTAYINQIVKTSSSPTIPTNSLLYNALGNTSVNLSWTNGNGEGRMVVLTPYQPVTFVPTILNSHGTSNTSFTAGNNNLPNAHKHIYRGAATNVTITNLLPGTTYHLAIFEYNGPGQPVYSNEPLRGFFTTLPTSGLAIGGFDAITFCPLQQVDVPYFFTGLLTAGNQLSVELSDITGSFASPVMLGVQSTTNNTGFITSTLPASLTEGIGYRLRIKSTGPASTSADNGANLQITTTVAPTFTVVGGQTSSCGTPIQLTTSQPGYKIQWFRNTQAIPFATTNSYMATESGSYQVGIAGASGGCKLSSVPTVLTISQAPAFDIQIAPQYCINSVIDFVPLSKPAGGTLSGPGISNGVFTGSVAGIGQHLITYTYVDPVSLCSYSQITSVQVSDLPTAPVVNAGSGCALSGITLSAAGADVTDSYVWYTVPVGGTAIAGQSTATFVTSGLTATTSYYVSILSNGCESPRTEVVATVVPGPAAPTITTAPSICGPGSTTITANGASAGQYRWYDVATGGTAINGETSAAYTTPSNTITKDYYVSASDGTCESARTKATVVVNAIPATPSITSSITPFEGKVSLCDNLLTLSAPAGFEYVWSNSAITQEIEVTQAGIYTVIVKSANGCSSSISSAVEVITPANCGSGQVVVYNAVSPNGDSKNEFLFIQNITQEATRSNKVSVFNRWGSLVAEINDYDNDKNVFRGVNKNGNDLPSGTYYYKIEFNGGGSRTGYLSLKR